MGAEFTTHFTMFMVLMFFTHRLWRCIELGKKNYDAPWATTDDKLHLLDHLLGAVLSILGATVTSLLLFVEMLSHIVGEATQLHIYINIGLCVTFLGSAYLAWHLEKEEDPTHPFYHWLGRRKEPR